MIVHRVLVDNVEQIPYPDKRAALVKEVRRLRRKIRDADKAIRPFILWFSERLGVSDEQMQKEIRERFS